MLNCILIELIDGSRRTFAFPDQADAEKWYEECRQEWNDGRTVVFHLPGSATAMYDGDSIAHIELVARETLTENIDCFPTVIFG
ncbi:MAG TPA: hypothetical protein VIJ76_04080 [Galbitalea sp.]